MEIDVPAKVQEPLTTNEVWGVDDVPEPRPEGACPRTNEPCHFWDEGVFNCLAAGQCLKVTDGI